MYTKLAVQNIGAEAILALGQAINDRNAQFFISGILVISFTKEVSLGAVISFMVILASGLTRTIAHSQPPAPENVILSTLLTHLSQVCNGRNPP